MVASHPPTCPRLAPHTGLARTIHIRFIYGILSGKITIYTVTYGVYIRFWPTLSEHYPLHLMKRDKLFAHQSNSSPCPGSACLTAVLDNILSHASTPSTAPLEEPLSCTGHPALDPTVWASPCSGPNSVGTTLLWTRQCGHHPSKSPSLHCTCRTRHSTHATHFNGQIQCGHHPPKSPSLHCTCHTRHSRHATHFNGQIQCGHHPPKSPSLHCTCHTRHSKHATHFNGQVRLLLVLQVGSALLHLPV